MHQVNCLVEDAVMQDLDRCKELLSGKYPQGIDFNTLLKELSTEWLEKNDPVEREKRRKSRKNKSKPAPCSNKTSRYISPATRDAVYKRDGGRCAYVGANGKRCNSTWDLEIHHDGIPFGKGGSHSTRNLKLLCAAHNRLEAERVYGKKYINKHNIIREATERYVVSGGVKVVCAEDPPLSFIRMRA